MKKLLMALAFASVSVAGMAQNNESTVPEQKYSVATNSFWSNWFIQANISGAAFWSNQEDGMGLSKSPFKDFRNNLGFSVAVGKWFTPGIGLRTKFNGVWGRTVVSDNKELNASKYWVLDEHVMFNLSNMFCGYSETRVWNVIPFFGAGINRNMSYNRYSMGLTAGLLNTFRLSRKLALNVEVSYGYKEGDFDGADEMISEYGDCTHDKMLNFELGLTYNLGKAKWNKTPDVEALKALTAGQIEALNAQLADAQQENSKLKNMLDECQKNAQKKEPEVIKEIRTAPVSVFFNIGKSKIASKKDMQNVKELAEIAKENDSKIVVTGYADSKTGSAAYNQKLSEKRAQTIADELVNMGVNRDNIEVKGEGGVNTLSPISYNRRATVQIK